MPTDNVSKKRGKAKIKISEHLRHVIFNGGEGEIRTHGPLRGNGFQDRRIRPLCHLSVKIFNYTHLPGLMELNLVL